MKKILIGLGVVVVIVAIAAIFLLSSLDSIIKTAVERVGSDLTQSRVTLNDVEISPTSGKGVMRGFSVTNPGGFSEDSAFKFDEVSVVIDIMTINSDPVIIKEIVITAPEILYELGNRGSNLDQLRKNVGEKTAGTKSGAGSADSGKDAGSDSPRIVIENLYLRDGTIAVSAPNLLDKNLSVPLPTIHLTDIGKDGRGATPGDVADQMVAAILSNVDKAIANAKIDIGALRDAAGKAAGEATKALEGAGAGAGAAMEDAAKGAEEQVKGLFKGLGK